MKAGEDIHVMSLKEDQKYRTHHTSMNIELIKEDDWYRNTLFWTPDTFLRQFRLFFPLICDVWKRTEHVVVEGPSKGGAGFGKP